MLPRLSDAAADAFLDRTEPRDAFERFAGDRRRAGRGEFVKPSANMRPAEGEINVAALCQDAISDKTVDLENTLEARGTRPCGRI